MFLGGIDDIVNGLFDTGNGIETWPAMALWQKSTPSHSYKRILYAITTLLDFRKSIQFDDGGALRKSNSTSSCITFGGA